MTPRGAIQHRFYSFQSSPSLVAASRPGREANDNMRIAHCADKARRLGFAPSHRKIVYNSERWMDWPASPLQYENADLFSHQIQQHLAFVNSTHVNSSSVGPQYRAILCPIQVSLILMASFPALAQYPLPMGSHGASRPPFGLTITFHRSGKVLPSFRLLSLDKPAPSLEEFRLLWLMSYPPHRGCS